MLNTYAPNLDALAGRLFGGVLILAADHPFVMAALLATVAGASAAVLFDAVAGWRHDHGSSPTLRFHSTKEPYKSQPMER